MSKKKSTIRPKAPAVGVQRHCSPSFRERALVILQTAHDAMCSLHNRTLDRDGDYSASPMTFGAAEGLQRLIAKLPSEKANELSSATGASETLKGKQHVK